MKQLLILCLLLATCSSAGPQIVGGAWDLPAYNATEDIVQHMGYTASYNHTTLIPDWVAWELTAEEVCDIYDYQCSFSRDPDVEYPKASREDYSRTGWDKGHMAPRADMKWNAQALEESYYFTNICPQDHEMNGGAWRKIEELTRRLARHYGNVYVVCGPVPHGERHKAIGPHGVYVPDTFFKALAINVGGDWRTVGFLMENSPQNFSPRHYAVTVDSVESVIGRDLFPKLPEKAESSFDWNIWKH